MRSFRAPCVVVTTRRRRRRPWPQRAWAEAVAASARLGRVEVPCVECGTVFAPRRQDAWYCSRACQTRRYRRTRVQDQGVRRCSQCAGPLPPGVRRDGLHCSDRCRQQAARARARAAGSAR